jgi:LPS-assembly lipoprotein
MTPSRRLLLALLPAGLAATLGGCGFTLKRPPQLQLRRIQLSGFAPLSPMADELRRQLRTSPGVTLVDSAAQAEVVLQALDDAREQVVAGSTAAAQVRELTLRVRLRFRVATPADRELIAPTELSLSRDMSYNESAALAKEQEAQLMFRTLQGDIASQVLRRLAALPAAAPPTPRAEP